jgi:hypothetical protein
MTTASMRLIKYLSCMLDFKGTYFSPHAFEKYSDMKLHDISSSGFRSVAIRKTVKRDQIILEIAIKFSSVFSLNLHENIDVYFN